MTDSTSFKEWFSTSELKGLPGLPTTQYRIKERAKRENWKSRPRKGRGGGREYHIDSLPRRAAIKLRAKMIMNTDDPVHFADRCIKEALIDQLTLLNDMKEEISSRIRALEAKMGKIDG